MCGGGDSRCCLDWVAGSFWAGRGSTSFLKCGPKALDASEVAAIYGTPSLLQWPSSECLPSGVLRQDGDWVSPPHPCAQTPADAVPGGLEKPQAPTCSIPTGLDSNLTCHQAAAHVAQLVGLAGRFTQLVHLVGTYMVAPRDINTTFCETWWLGSATPKPR